MSGLPRWRGWSARCGISARRDIWNRDGTGRAAAKRARVRHCDMDRGRGDELPSWRGHYPPGDVLDEPATMKWGLLAAIVFVCAVALFAALPRSALLGLADAVQYSFDTISVTVLRMVGWADKREEGARGGGAGSGRTVAFDADLSGRARVIDGDTIDVGTVRVRLHGVDAPESAQSCLAAGERWPCGQRATQALVGRIGGRTVDCSERDRDRYGRIVAVCRHGGRDVNAWLAGQGWALAYRRYSWAYVNEESSAESGAQGHMARPVRGALGLASGESACRVPVGGHTRPRTVLRAVAGPRETSATTAVSVSTTCRATGTMR